MANYGFIVARVFTSRAQIPISGATVTVETSDMESVLGARVTNKDGRTAPIQIEAPKKALSESPQNRGSNPFASVNIRISHPGYYTYYIQDAQIFDGETTIQNAELVPLPQSSEYNMRLNEYFVTPQPL